MIARDVALLLLAGFSLYVAVYLTAEAAVGLLVRHERRRRPDPHGRDLRAMSTYEASAVLGMEAFFRDWDALVEKERQS